MTKVTLSDLANLNNQTSATTLINSNFDTVESAFDNTLSRDGTSPNTMGASLDMNSHRIINLPAPVSAGEPARLQDILTPTQVTLLDASSGVSSFIAPILTHTTAAAVRADIAVQTSVTDIGVSVGNKFFALTAGLSDTTTKTNNTAAIQSAIDYAYNNGFQTISISSGIFYCNPGIYLDPPGNLRSNINSPTIFSFSLHLTGAGGLSNHNNYGTQLHFTDNTTNALILGPGQGMRVSNLSIIGPSGANSRAALPANGIGIAMSGHSRALLDCVGVENFRQGYVIGFNTYNILGDSTTFFKCTAFECFVGLNINETQNYIINLVSCDFGGNTTHIQSNVAKSVNVFGGNYSTADAWHNAFTIGSYTNLAYFSDSSQLGAGNDNATFTVTLSVPDQAMADGAYTAFVINTTAFGPIPLILTNYNSSTHVATFSFYQGWLQAIGMQTAQLNGGTLATTFNTALSAATTLYATERVTVFEGLCFNVDGVHVENPAVMTRFFHLQSSFGGDFASKFNRITFNYNISNADQHGGSATLESIFQCQQAFPFIEAIINSAGTIEISNIVNTTAYKDRVLIDVQESNFSLYKRLIVRNCDLLPNIRVATSPIASGPPSSFQYTSTGTGWGDYDNTPFWATGDTLRYYSSSGLGSLSFHGHFPAFGQTPFIDITSLSNAIAGSGSFPAILGRVPYRVGYVGPQDAVSGVNASRWVESNHQHWSYGSNLTVTWSYVAGTNWVVLSDVTKMFAGLRVILNNGGGNEFYTCTGVYPTLGAITVVRWRAGTGVSDLAGTGGTTYTAGTIIQEAFSWSHSGFLPTAKFTTNTTSGATAAAVGDLTGAQLVNLKITAVGAAAYTTRTAAQMFGDIIGAYAGLSYMLSIENSNAGTTTLTAADGSVTINGTATIAQNTCRLFYVTFPTATTCTINSLGVTATI